MSVRLTNKNKESLTLNIILLALALLSMICAVAADFPEPSAPNTMTNISTQSPGATAGYMMNTSGGTITVVNINATTQNPHWKAYVGNITGRYALQDASGNSVFNWTVASTEGEIYATRKSTVVSWDDITCANLTHIQTEETALSMLSTSVDSISNTFSDNAHDPFYAGLISIPQNSCNSTNLYVNSQESSDFTELLLYDGNDLIYTALIEDSATGFDGREFDFQMILPDSGLEGNQDPEEYYFYVELI